MVFFGTETVTLSDPVGPVGVKVADAGFALPPFAVVVALSAKLGTAGGAPAYFSEKASWPLPPTNALAGLAGPAIFRSAVPTWASWRPPRQTASPGCCASGFRQ